MGQIQNLDFFYPSEKILFDLCMESIFGFESDNNVEIQIDRRALRDLLAKYDLQSYTELLVKYTIIWNELKVILDERRTKRHNNDKNLLPYKLKVSRILNLFLSGETTRYRKLVVSVSDPVSQINIADFELFNQLKEVFLKEFEKLGLNRTELTTDEALESIDNQEAWEWFADQGFDIDEIRDEPELVEWYRSEHCKARNISFELINETIAKLEIDQNKIKGRVGAKIKNLGLGEFAKRLTYLHTIKEFLNQNVYLSIKDFPLKNDSCRFVYEYFKFWGLLNEQINFERDDKEKRASYIKALIRNNKNYFEKRNFKNIRDYFFTIDTNLELMIDLFKKVKDGSISPEQFHKLLSTTKH